MHESRFKAPSIFTALIQFVAYVIMTLFQTSSNIISIIRSRRIGNEHGIMTGEFNNAHLSLLHYLY